MRERTSASHACGSTPFILGGDDEAIHGRGALPPAIGPAEQPRFSSKGHAAQRALGRIVRDANASVVEEQRERRPALKHVLDRLGEVMPARQLSDLLAKIGMKIVNQRPAL